MFSSFLGIIIQQTLNFSGAAATTAIRAIRIARIFKLFRKQKSLRIIFETFIVTLPALMNVGGLLLLLIYIYAVLGMNLFATIKLTVPFNPNLNF